MPLYTSYYSLPTGGAMSTQVYARDRDHLDDLLALRKMGEWTHHAICYAEPKMASDLFRRGALAKANHALVWAAMIATRAGLVDSWGLLNDGGMLHKMAHIMESNAVGAYSYSQVALDEFANTLERFERTVPGLHPSYGVALVEEPDDGLFPYQRDMIRFARNAGYGFTPGMLTGRTAHMIVVDDVETMDDTIKRDLAAKRNDLVRHGKLAAAELRDLIGDDHATLRSKKAKHGTKAFDMDRLAQSRAAKSALAAKLVKKPEPPAVAGTITVNGKTTALKSLTITMSDLAEKLDVATLATRKMGSIFDTIDTMKLLRPRDDYVFPVKQKVDTTADYIEPKTASFTQRRLFAMDLSSVEERMVTAMQMDKVLDQIVEEAVAGRPHTRIHDAILVGA